MELEKYPGEDKKGEVGLRGCGCKTPEDFSVETAEMNKIFHCKGHNLTILEK